MTAFSAKTNSDPLLQESRLVGNVMSSWNSFRESGPIRIAKAKESRVWDADGRERIDWIMGWGSLALGHTPAFARAATMEALELGFGFQYETESNEQLATLICDAVPAAERTRIANSGTEATLHAIRICRAVTGKRKILKFEGHFHGLNDYLLYGVDGGPYLGTELPGGLIAPVAGSKGLINEILEDLVLIVPFNDKSAVEYAFDLHGEDIAGIIVEPISLNTGCVYPVAGYLSFLRETCNHYGALLIFDEILTGFRVAPGSAQRRYGVSADLTCLGKALGCGFPIAAVCGRQEYMDSLSPVGAVEMAGTNTGRRLAVIGAIRAIVAMRELDAAGTLERLQQYFIAGCKTLFDRYSVPAIVIGAGGRIGIHIGLTEEPRSFREIVSNWNRAYHVKCYLEATERHGLFGFMLPLGPCPEPVTLSAAHTLVDIDQTLNALEDILRRHPYRAAI